MKRSYEKFVARIDQMGLTGMLDKRLKKSRVTVIEIYQGGRAPSIVAARRDVYRWLNDIGYGNNEIARMFDRAQSGIMKMLRNGEKG